jgi:hypothetical protein
MRPYLLVLAGLAVVVGSQYACAQRLENQIGMSHPDFSGKWLYNYDESSPEVRKLPLAKNLKIFNTIHQDSSKITIAETSDPVVPEIPNLTMTIYTDGRDYDLFPQMRERGFTATIAWEGGKLVTSIFDKTKRLINRKEMELLANGKKLRFYAWDRDSFDTIVEGSEIFDRVKQ